MLALALLGDALLYVVLPIHAAAFGVTLAWVGVLLSANRFVRIFGYGAIAVLARAIGPLYAALALLMLAALALNLRAMLAPRGPSS